MVAASVAGDPGRLNQDRAGHTGSMAWVIDGASNLDSTTVTPNGDDAAWIAGQLHEFLANAAPEVALDNLLEQAATALQQQYQIYCRKAAVTPALPPSAGLVVVRWQESLIEYLLLGDCSLTLVDIQTRHHEVIQETKLRRLDDSAIDELSKFRRSGLSYAEAKERLMPTLQKHRRMMNTEEGYWVFGLDPTAVSHAITGHLKLDTDTALILASDGFSRLWDTFGAVDAGWGVYHSLATDGASTLLKKLRELENQDRGADRWPRFKKSDDASVALVSFHRGGV